MYVKCYKHMNGNARGLTHFFDFDIRKCLTLTTMYKVIILKQKHTYKNAQVLQYWTSAVSRQFYMHIDTDY